MNSQQLNHVELERPVSPAKAGSEMEAYMLEFYDPLLTFIAAKLPAGSSVEPVDILHDAYCRAWAAADVFEGKSKRAVFSWLKKIAYHVLIDRIRFDGRRNARNGASFSAAESRRQPPEACAAAGPRPSQLLNEKEWMERLRIALNDLPQEQMRAVEFYYRHNLTLKEVSERMQRSPGAINALLHRARVRLRQVFGDESSFSI